MLLILAGISISMLTGENSIINYAGEGVSETTISDEKEFVSLSTIQAIEENKYGNIEKNELQEIINNNKSKDEAITVYEAANKFLVVYEEENRAYKIDSTGKVFGAIEINTQTGEIIAGEKTYGSILEYLLGGTKVEIAKGSFIEYNVAYTDAYYNNYLYTTTNGWRILDYTENGDGTYSNVKIISTGVPAGLSYNYSNTTNNSWWITDNNTLITFKNLLGGDDYTFYEGTPYYALQAAAGMYYNLSNIKFAGSYKENMGGFISITSNEITYDENSTEEVTGEDLFNLYGKKAIVRLLTIPEVNKALGRTDINSTETISSVEDSIGLYRLDKIKNVDGMEAYNYTTGIYWLASPYPDSSYYYYVGLISYGGGMGYSTNSLRGVRPVVCLSSDVYLIDTNENEIAEIIF